MSARTRASSAQCCAIRQRAPKKRGSSGARRNCSTTSVSAPGRTIRRGALRTEISGALRSRGRSQPTPSCSLWTSRGGNECLGDQGAPGAARAHSRGRHHAAPHRARHARGHERLRPGAGSRLRQAHRGGRAGRSAARSESDRGLSRRGDGAARMKLLEIRGLEVRYGGIRAVKGIDLEIAAGELVCLIGANGAGKSSTLRAVSGLAPIAPGSVRFGGRDLAGIPAFARARAGLVMVPEGRGVFAQLSVEENLAMGAYARADAGVATDRARVFELFPRLAERRRQTAGTLSGGEQQMLAIGRALMSRPRLLALDEPSMGLAPIAAQKILQVIRDINSTGVTVLLVEQNARSALALAHRAYVMESGEITLSGEARALLADPRVREAYLGEAAG